MILQGQIKDRIFKCNYLLILMVLKYYGSTSLFKLCVYTEQNI